MVALQSWWCSSRAHQIWSGKLHVKPGIPIPKWRGPMSQFPTIPLARPLYGVRRTLFQRCVEAEVRPLKSDESADDQMIRFQNWSRWFGLNLMISTYFNFLTSDFSHGSSFHGTNKLDLSSPFPHRNWLLKWHILRRCRSQLQSI